jgi:hypothetical protein
VRGTIWLVQDRCRALTKVSRGTVQVADFQAPHDGLEREAASFTWHARDARGQQQARKK